MFTFKAANQFVSKYKQKGILGALKEALQTPRNELTGVNKSRHGS